MPTSGSPTPAPREDDLDLTTPEEIAVRQRRRRLIVWGSVLLALLVAGWFAGRPTLRAIKGWQARRAAAEAMRLLDEGQPDQAVGKIQDALSLRSTDPTVVQTTATFLTRIGHGREATGFWKEVAKTRSLTTDEQRNYATALLQSGDLAEAGSHLRAAWPQNTPGTPTDWVLAMQIAVRNHDGAEAVRMARLVVDAKEGTANDLQRLNAAQVLLSVNDPASRAAGETTLRALADSGKSAESLEALLIKTRQAAQEVGQRRTRQQEVPAEEVTALLKLADQVENHPKTQTAQRLLALQARMVAQPDSRPALLQQAIDRYGRGKNEDLSELGSWLYAQGEFQRLLEVLTPQRATGSRTLYLEYLDTLGALGRWDDIRQSIEGQKFTLEPLVAEMYLARCAKQLNHPDGATAHWAAALRAAGTNPDKLLTLGRYAQADGEAATAEAAYRAAIKANPDSRPTREALLGLLQSLGRTRDVLAEIRSMLATAPQDTSLRNDDAYLSALLGENLPAARDAGRDLMRLEPASIPHRITLALAEMKLGHDLTALEILQGANAASYMGQPRFVAVGAAILWRTGFRKEALQAIANLPREALLPEERQLVEEIK